jgi:hypothetical protein
MEWDPTKYDDQQDLAFIPDVYQPTHVHNLDISVDDDSKVLFVALDDLSPGEGDGDDEDMDDEFVAIEENDPTNQVVDYLDVTMDPFEFAPNVMAAVACFNRKVMPNLHTLNTSTGRPSNNCDQILLGHR